MTFHATCWGDAVGWIVVAAEQPLILRLEPQDRVRVLAALAAVILLGFALVAFAWWGARATRRYMNRTPLDDRKPDARTGQDDWATRPLYPESDSPSQEEG